MGYIMTEENPSTFMGNLLQLMHEHGQEVYGEKVNVNLTRVATIIHANLAKVFVLWYNDKPVGYSFWTCGQDLMFANKLRGDEIALYVQKLHRGRPAIRFMKYIENTLRGYGFHRIVRGCQRDNPLYTVLRKMGYTFEEVMLVKEV